MGARVELAVPGSDSTLGVIRHGHYGRPVIVFPSEAGRAEDFANNGMLEAVQDIVRALMLMADVTRPRAQARPAATRRPAARRRTPPPRR